MSLTETTHKLLKPIIIALQSNLTIPLSAKKSSRKFCFKKQLMCWKSHLFFANKNSNKLMMKQYVNRFVVPCFVIVLRREGGGGGTCASIFLETKCILIYCFKTNVDILRKNKCILIDYFKINLNIHSYLFTLLLFFLFHR